MAAFNKFFASVLLAVLYATTATLAVPFAPDAKHTTHRVRNIGRGLQIETFHPESSYEVINLHVDLQIKVLTLDGIDFRCWCRARLDQAC